MPLAKELLNWESLHLTGNETMKCKTGVINDPLGQTHRLASSEYCLRLNLFCFEKWGRTDERHGCNQLSLPTTCGSAEWINWIEEWTERKFLTIDSKITHMQDFLNIWMEDEQWILIIHSQEHNDWLPIFQSLYFAT